MTITFSKPEIKLIDDSVPIKVLSDDTTNYQWGKSPLSRNVTELIQYGIINLDKPPNPTSHEVVSYVKKILNIPKAGHSGTLDPAVTGVLPIALNKATRILDTLLLAGKEYITVILLHDDIGENIVRTIFSEYKGLIYQRPPMRASVKRVLRKREIYELEILEMKERKVLVRVNCQAGTYIRKLAHDIGQSIGCGAHMKELRRIRTGPLNEDTFLSTLHDLYDAYAWYKEHQDDTPLRNIILPMEYAVKHLPKVFVKDSAVDTLCHGAPLALPGVSKYTQNFKTGDLVALSTLKHELIGLGEAQVDDESIEQKDQGIITRTKRVLMPIGTYPSQ